MLSLKPTLDCLRCDLAIGGNNEYAEHQLQTPPLSTPNHRPRGLALLPVQSEPAGGGRNAARARHRRILRDDPALNRQTRSADRLAPAAAARPTCDVWHLDEVVVKIAGRSFWLWRAFDQFGVVLDEILQSRRGTQAARRLLVQLLKRLGFVPKLIVTDKLRSSGAAKREVVPGLNHWSHKGLNNHTENSHLPFRKQELGMQSFRSPG